MNARKDKEKLESVDGESNNASYEELPQLFGEQDQVLDLPEDFWMSHPSNAYSSHPSNSLVNFVNTELHEYIAFLEEMHRQSEEKKTQKVQEKLDKEINDLVIVGCSLTLKVLIDNIASGTETQQSFSQGTDALRGPKYRAPQVLNYVHTIPQMPPLFQQSQKSSLMPMPSNSQSLNPLLFQQGEVSSPMPLPYGHQRLTQEHYTSECREDTMQGPPSLFVPMITSSTTTTTTGAQRNNRHITSPAVSKLTLFAPTSSQEQKRKLPQHRPDPMNSKRRNGL